MSIEWLQHKDKKILYIKYGSLSKEEMLDQVFKATKMIVDNKNMEILTLSDMRDCFVDEQFMETAKSQGKISLPLTKKAAIIGIFGVKKLLLNAYNAFASKPRVLFNTIEEAKDWLVSND